MNGSTRKIEIFQPFGEAFELMKRILFRPFDFKKWCVMGFAAFLAGHFAGMGFSIPTPPFGNYRASATERDAIAAGFFDEWKPWLPIIIGICAVLFLALVLVLNWIKARGSFVFTDCVVRNRAAIVMPWKEYRKEGNSYFLFLMTIFVASLALVGILLLTVFLVLPVIDYRPEGAALIGWIIVGVLVFVCWMLVAIALGLISYFMAPLMYIRRCRSFDAFRETANLIGKNLGSFVLFILFGIVLILALMIVGAVATCLTCCLASLPYVGTVILLPAWVLLRAFSLLFLRQFGPEYDVWAGLPPIASSGTSAPPPLPP